MFREFYYSSYQFFKKGVTKMPFFDAYFSISFLQCLNIISLLGVVNHYSNYLLSKDRVLFIVIIIIGLIGLINYFLLYQKRDEILTTIDKLNERRKRNIKYFYWMYIIGSYTFMYLVPDNFFVMRY